MVSHGVDGFMLVGADRPSGTWQLLRDAGVVVVHTWSGDSRFNSVVVDNEKAGRLAVQHLTELGHKRIGVVISAQQFNDRQKARLAGTRAAISDAGLELRDWRLTEQPLTLAGGRTGCSLMLALEEPPTALIGGIDILAIGCIEEAHSRGLVVPNDISVVGIDNIEMSAHVFPSLSSVYLPVGRIGDIADNRLLEAQVQMQSSSCPSNWYRENQAPESQSP